MRCPDCNKFVSYDEPTIEEQCVGIDDDGTLSGEVRVVLSCCNCGTELKEYLVEFEVDVEHECSAKCENEDLEHYTIEESEDWSSTERYQTYDSNGKLIKNSRYKKHYYGFEGTVTIKCNECGDVIQVSVSGEEQANCFEELV